MNDQNWISRQEESLESAMRLDSLALLAPPNLMGTPLPLGLLKSSSWREIAKKSMGLSILRAKS
jgi:hypothetical protein